MAGRKTWIVTTTGDRPIGDVAHDLVDAGLETVKVLAEIGCITGSGAERVATKLRRVPGVADVSPDLTVSVGPPKSPETW